LQRGGNLFVSNGTIFVLNCSAAGLWETGTFVALFALSVSFAAESGRCGAFFGKEGIIENDGNRFFRGGVTASTEMLAARRHTGAHSPVSGAKTIIANTNQLAYAA
jgi:hypothetical protein